MINPFLVGNNIYLRAPDLESDIIDGGWAQWFNHRETTQYLIHGVVPNTPKKQFEYLNKGIESPDKIILAIVDIKDDILLGTISLQSIDLLNRSAEIAMIIGAKDYLKYIVPFEAMALMTEHGFTRLNLNRIYAGQHIKLWKWVNRLELLGYKLEGYARETHARNGTIEDSVRMSILAADFFSILQKRKGQYIPENLIAFISTARKENVCEKLTGLINDFYNDLSSIENFSM